jgi:hypothetical protein
MKISDLIDYAATPQEVFVMLADEGFQNRKCEATGALRHTVSIQEQDGRTIIMCTRDMPSDGFPAFVKNMVGETLAVAETQDWGPPGHDGARSGRLTVDIPGAPLGLTGDLSLAPGGQGSLETIEGDLKANVPMLGRKIEEAAAPAIRSAIRVESETGAAWLATQK